MNTVLFRADASPEIGFGHVSRCLAIAADIKESFQCCLVTRRPSAFVLERLGAEGVDLLVIPEEVPLFSEPEWLDKESPSRTAVVCLDGYDFTNSYRREIRGCGFRLVVIDDVPDGEYDADAILNHAPGIVQSAYSATAGCRFFLGLSHLMIHPSFCTPKIGFRKGWFICLGGSDPQDHVATVAQRVLRSTSEHVTIVLGAAYQYRDRFERTFEAEATILTGLTPAQMAAQMQTCAFGICSASTTAMEFLATGGRLGVIQTAENQVLLYNGLIESGYARPWTEVLSKPTALPPVDIGRQSFRSLFRYLSQPEIAIRPASFEDGLLLLEWRNDPTTAKNSKNSRPISQEDHLKWLKETLTRAEIRLWIAEEGCTAVGTCRSFFDGAMYTLSWTVAPAARGKGVGSRIVAALLRVTPRPWRAEILPDNTASLRIAHSFGLLEQDAQDGICIFEG